MIDQLSMGLILQQRGIRTMLSMKPRKQFDDMKGVNGKKCTRS
jgi:hypothetical protein